MLPKLQVLHPNQVAQTNALSLILGWEAALTARNSTPVTGSLANTPFHLILRAAPRQHVHFA